MGTEFTSQFAFQKSNDMVVKLVECGWLAHFAGVAKESGFLVVVMLPCGGLLSVANERASAVIVTVSKRSKCSKSATSNTIQ